MNVLINILKVTILVYCMNKQSKKKISFPTALLLITAVGGTFSYTIPVYVISLDEDASVELHVNLYQRDVFIIAYDTALINATDNIRYT